MKETNVSETTTVSHHWWGLMRLDVLEPVLVAVHWLGRINLSLALQSTFLLSASASLL